MHKEKIEEKVFRLKVTLVDSKPSIWRVLDIVDSETFFDLHVAIQGVMGWENSHLHCFVLGKPSDRKNTIRIGMKFDEEIDDESELDEDLEVLSEYVNFFAKKQVEYQYDFGDNWVHKIELKEIRAKEKGVEYPRCVDGRMACPPDDCGGIYGYYEILEDYGNKASDAHDVAVEVLGEGFDPKYFSVDDVDFANILNTYDEEDDDWDEDEDEAM
ncbi:MAG: plasmid pRiA4b ORF-3 family protein [Holosporales bacterium]|jgi:hypothetical protein|nr:plasmid pRiA4b ORF-3 family protein [Holosporales bacterium]